MNLLKAISVLFLTLLLTSCCLPSSINPLSPPGEAHYDKQLEGTWYYKEENGNIVYLHVGRVKGNFTKAIFTEIGQSGTLGFSVLIMFPSFIGDKNFLNIEVKQVDDEISFEFKGKGKGYFFAKYEFAVDDSLLVSMIDIDGFAKGIQDGKIKGEITYRKPVIPEGSEDKPREQESKVIDCLRITDKSENIVQFIKDSNTRELFSTGFILKRLIVN